MERLTGKEAFDAMVLSLEKFYDSTGSDGVAALLGSMLVPGDGGTTDLAVRGDWVNEVRRSRRGYSRPTY
jgi:hypothetical protein